MSKPTKEQLESHNLSQRQLAKLYDVSTATISNILNPEKYQAYLKRKREGKSFYNRKRATKNKARFRAKQKKEAEENDQ